MLYLSENHVAQLALSWDRILSVLRDAAATVSAGDFAQPVKPYLRYRQPANRIIAMPAFVGGGVEMAGLKWIASFPNNLASGLPRAHALTVLNHAATGEPLAVINASSLSAIRTAGVSALMIAEFLRLRPDLSAMKVGLTGFGPIAQQHLRMLRGLWGARISQVTICEVDPARRVAPPDLGFPVRFCGDWREAYRDAQVFITCTTARERYIDQPPAAGSLHLNVSLRDYLPRVGRAFTDIVVDDWEEVCRENTDIEEMHRQTGLRKDQTLNLFAICGRGAMAGMTPADTVMFNPMGMAVFDVAVATLYLRAAREQQIGLTLPQ